MLSISDLHGFDPSANPAPAKPQSETKPLVPGSPVAKALYSVLSGRPVTIVRSPPGAGKTTLAVDLVDTLVRRTSLHVVIGCPTRAQIVELAPKLLARLPENTLNLTYQGIDEDERLPEYVREYIRSISDRERRPENLRIRVNVRTVASLVMSPAKCDLLIIDEAYQCTYSDLLHAADNASQVLLVGDPGQIGPVVTVDTTTWDHLERAPHRRAPDVMQDYPDADVIDMDCTYRVGPDTVEALAPLYAFPFDSRRVPRWIRTGPVDHPEIEALDLGEVTSVTQRSMLDAVVERAVSFVGSELVTPDGTTVVDERDVVILAARNAQTSMLRAILASRGIEGILVGTADMLQGGQWPVAVALDPLAGADDISHHSSSLGRLCVMISRHMGHLSWLYADGWRQALTDSGLDRETKRAAIATREVLVRETP